MKQSVTAAGSWRWWENNTARQDSRNESLQLQFQRMLRVKQSPDEKCRYQMKVNRLTIVLESHFCQQHSILGG
ncbi:hypothetical protein QLX08_004544 [Tetragonisca angustula]|uniref:Uncharacterized protein n=1 Tax=Tetragonisca angustula TaxID=166442 RepID=A0AAW1A269_9HYME